MHSSFYWLLPVAFSVAMLRLNAVFVKSVSSEYDISAADDLLLMASPIFCSLMSLASWASWSWFSEIAISDPLVLTGLGVWASTSVLLLRWSKELNWAKWYSENAISLGDMSSPLQSSLEDFQAKIAA